MKLGICRTSSVDLQIKGRLEVFAQQLKSSSISEDSPSDALKCVGLKIADDI